MINIGRITQIPRLTIIDMIYTRLIIIKILYVILLFIFEPIHLYNKISDKKVTL